MVYTQFQTLVGDPGEELAQQERLRNAEYSITSARKDSGDNSIEITIRNNADVVWNLTEHATINVGPEGQQPQTLSALDGTEWDANGADPNTCFEAGSGNPWVLTQGESNSCDIGVEFPSATEGATNIEMTLSGTTKASYSCSVTSNTATFC